MFGVSKFQVKKRQRECSNVQNKIKSFSKQLLGAKEREKEKKKGRLSSLTNEPDNYDQFLSKSNKGKNKNIFKTEYIGIIQIDDGKFIQKNITAMLILVSLNSNYSVKPER